MTREVNTRSILTAVRTSLALYCLYWGRGWIRTGSREGAVTIVDGECSLHFNLVTAPLERTSCIYTPGLPMIKHPFCFPNAGYVKYTSGNSFLEICAYIIVCASDTKQQK